MSADCCTYGCVRNEDCPAGSVVAERLLADIDLPTIQSDAEYAESARKSQWYTRPYTLRNDKPEARIEPPSFGAWVLFAASIATVLATVVAMVLRANF